MNANRLLPYIYFIVSHLWYFPVVIVVDIVVLVILFFFLQGLDTFLSTSCVVLNSVAPIIGSAIGIWPIFTSIICIGYLLKCSP